MIQQRISGWIQHPESLGEESLQELRALLERYPYFQTAWVLYLKNLYLLKDEAFREELRRGALYVADLGVLFYYIEGDRFVIQKHAEERPASDVSDRTLDLIDRFLSESTEPLQTPKEIPLTMEVNLDYTSVLMNSEDGTSADGTETPQLRGQELIDSFIARDRAGDVSAAQQEISRTPDEDAEILPDAPSGEGKEPASEDMDTPDEGEATEVSETADEDEDESYFTETLAKIYIKQQRYDKALEIIKKLNLKYPKKNIYFADQIRFLEKLIINAKSK